jgi:hypothetical protein
MLSIALTLLLATWTVTAVRYAMAIRNEPVGVTALQGLDRVPERLAA